MAIETHKLLCIVCELDYRDKEPSRPAEFILNGCSVCQKHYNLWGDGALEFTQASDITDELEGLYNELTAGS